MTMFLLSSRFVFPDSLFGLRGLVEIEAFSNMLCEWLLCHMPRPCASDGHIDWKAAKCINIRMDDLEHYLPRHN